MCAVRLLSGPSSGQTGEGLPLFVVVAGCFTGSLGRCMVISSLLAQVQQHENEYVITLINHPQGVLEQH